MQLHRHAGGADGLDQRVDVVGTRCRRECTATVTFLAQHAEHAAQFVQCASAGRLDRLQRLLGLVRLGVDHVRAHAGLHGDHAHRMGDDVVQLLGDAQPFAADSLTGIGVALAFQSLGALRCVGQPLAAGAHASPMIQAIENEQRVGWNRSTLWKSAVGWLSNRIANADAEHQEGNQTGSPAGVRGHRVEGDDGHERQPGISYPEAAQCNGSAHRHDHGPEGVSAPPCRARSPRQQR